MSVEILEALKEQSERLSPVEKRLLADYLILGIEKTDETDLGLPDVRKDEKRRLRDKYGGLYVALDGDKLLGTGRNFPEAAHWARIAGIKDAFIDFLPPVDYVGEMGGW
jgi:hypothetical protein